MKKQIYPILVVLIVISFIGLYKLVNDDTKYEHDAIYGYKVGVTLNDIPETVSAREASADFQNIRHRLNVENFDYADNEETTSKLKYIKNKDLKDDVFGNINYLYLTVSENRVEGITAEIPVENETKCINVITDYIASSSKQPSFKAGKIETKKVEIDGKLNSITHAGSSWTKDGFTSISGLYCSAVDNDVRLYLELARVPAVQ